VLAVALLTPLHAQFAYVVNDVESSTVSGYSIGSNGALTPVPGRDPKVRPSEVAELQGLARNGYEQNHRCRVPSRTRYLNR
jgi:hypothetical protein